MGRYPLDGMLYEFCELYLNVFLDKDSMTERDVMLEFSSVLSAIIVLNNT